MYKHLVDRAIIFLCCAAYSILTAGINAAVVPLLIAFTLQSLILVFDCKKASFFISLALLSLCLFLPGLRAYLPMVIYQICRDNSFILLLPASILYLIQLAATAPLASMIYSMLLIFAFVLCRRTKMLQALQDQYRTLRDTNTEWQLQMEYKNKELMEKQDYEVHVATLQERTRIAREIHDNVGHMLSRSILVVGALKAINHDEALKESLEDLSSTLTNAMNSVRESVHDLHKEGIDLQVALSQLMKNFVFCPISFEYDISGAVDPKLKYSLISIVKEGLSNIIKHSSATQASVLLREHPALYQLIIDDNGTGAANYSDGSFYFETAGGIGLESIRERVAAFQGSFRIHTDSGFRIFITIPKNAPSLHDKPRKEPII